MPRRLLILGSTGSIGTQALEIVEASPELELAGLSAESSWEALVEQARRFGVDRIALHGRLLTEKGTYKPLAESKNAEGTIEADLPTEGSWGLILVAHDGAGHASADPEVSPSGCSCHKV